MKNEGVIRVGDFATHYFDFSFYNLLYVVAHLFGIIVPFTIDDDAMLNTLHQELKRFEVTNFKRRVVEDVEVFRTEGILGTRRNR